MKKEKKRLDVLLVERGFAPSREKAKALIMAGIVYVDQNKEDKAGASFDPEEVQIEVRGASLPYVSRGGLKLEKALKAFPIDLTGRVCMDIGASTGGFTDCLLKHGAAFVHSVDVGYNLLDYSLRNDSRVAVHEKTNIMQLESLDPVPDCAVADLSFRSISGAASKVLNLTKKKRMVALIKPQFEVPRGLENFDGVVRDRELLRQTLVSVYGCLEKEGVKVLDACESPVHGHKGNTEFLALLTNEGTEGLSCEAFLARAIEH